MVTNYYFLSFVKPKFLSQNNFLKANYEIMENVGLNQSDYYSLLLPQFY